MLQTDYSEEREALIAQSVAGLVAELRLLDVEYLVSFITLQMYNHVADHVASSSERFFTPGFITFGNGCDVSVSWEKAPEVTIDLIMNLDWAKAYFSVHLGAENAHVRLNYFYLEITGGDAEANSLRLKNTIQDNKI